MVEERNSDTIWKEIVGEQKAPFFNIREGVIDESFQATLDSFQSWGRFLQEVEAVDSALEKMYGEGKGINSAILYGSDVSGLAILPSSPHINGSRSSGDGSDMDVLLAVERGQNEEERRDLAQDMMDKSGNDDQMYPPQPINPVVYTVDEFVSDLRDAREQAETLEDLTSVDIRMNMSDHYFELGYVERMRAFLTGHIFHQEFRGDEIVEEISAAEDLLMNGDNIAQEVEDIFYERSPDYTERIREFQENNEYAAVWWMINNSDRLEVPRDYEKNDEGFFVDQMNVEAMDPADLLKEATVSQLDDKTQQRTLSSYTFDLEYSGSSDVTARKSYPEDDPSGQKSLSPGSAP